VPVSAASLGQHAVASRLWASLLFFAFFFRSISVFFAPVAAQVPSHSAVFINEPRLSEFKQIVVSKGIQAEMSGGVLICNNVVAVRRVSSTANTK